MEKTLGSLFDGIGGFPLAGSYSGFTSLWASEIEPFPIRVTKKRFPQMKHLGDITKINGAEIEPTAVICGGSPCQDLSVAGLRAGMAQKCSQCGKEFDIADEITHCPVCGAEIEKTRSGLFMEQIRIVKEMREADAKRGRTGQSIRPRFMVWENVPGAFSSHSGEDFRIVLEETCRIADSSVHIPRPSEGWPTVGAIMGNGFSVAWRVLDAQYWGIPQRRRRIFFVADFAGFSVPKILFKCESMSGNPSAGGTTGQRIAADAQESLGAADRVPITFQNTGRGWWNQSDVGATVRTPCGGDSTMVNLAVVPKVARILTARADSSPCADRGQNVIVVPVSAGFNGKAGAKAGNIGFENELAPTLMVEKPPNVLTYDARGNGNGATVCTMTGDHNGRIGDYTALAIIPKVTGTLTSKMAKGTGGPAGDECQNLVCFSEAHVPKKYGFAVRRLTPLECERLQGYPDGWTDIPKASDSARYKALGNSVAVPCVAYIMRGIACELEKAARKKKERENNESD